MKSRLIAVSAICAACITSNAETLDFTYNYTEASPSAYGKDKAETVDVAIRLASPAMVGKKVTALSVPVFGDVSDLSGFQGFLTTELKTKNQNKAKVNDPDICAIDGTYTDGMLSVNFTEPYTITEKGVYVGYSVTITGGESGDSGKPVAVVPGSVPDSFWFHSTSSVQKWSDYATRYDLISDMTVSLEGGFPENAAVIQIPEKIYAGIGTDATADVVIANQGLEEIKSIAYSYEAAGISGTGEYVFREPIPGKIGYPAEVSLPIGIYRETAQGELSIMIDKVNGKSNELTAATSSAPFEVMPFVPRNRPLVEEYTGLNCGWCPMGYVTLAEMNEIYGRDFVALSYHSSSFEQESEMVYLSTSQFPYQPSGYPASQVNRITSPSVDDIPKTWESQRRNMPCGEVEVVLDWADDSRKTLKAVSKTRFIHDIDDSPYLVTFALVADGLSNPKWAQYNAYSFDDTDVSGLTGKWWDLFVHANRYVFGLVFDDVVLSFPDAKGIPESLPSNIKQGEIYENTFSVNIDDIHNLAGLDVVNDFGFARVVAVIVDSKTGAVINCASSDYPSQSGVKELSDSEATAIRCEFYDLTGCRVFNPGNGILLKIERLSDGSVRTSKVIR
ncbi:MAG: hypothetical protein K2H38_03915 [Muribaculaceae bacterium]|nr:hypothetical protein [Muribaculaceae bacterium]MDE6551782.1 hypothetical protein [Muribaculaceae bacterium]